MASVDYGTGTRDIDTDALERWAQEQAQASGVSYDRSDLDGILRNISYDQGGVSLEQAQANLRDNYAERANNTPGVDLSGEHTGQSWITQGGAAGQGGGGGGGVPGAGGGAPSPNLPGYTKPDPFTVTPWRATTLDDVLADPGYQFRFDQGTEAVKRWKAKQGSLYASDTPEALVDYGQGLASQEYGAIDDRRYRAWAAENGLDLSAYQTNYQTQYSDPYRFAYQSALDTFQPQMTEWLTNQNAALQYGLQDKQLSTTDAFNLFLAGQNNDQWQKDFGWRVAQGD